MYLQKQKKHILWIPNINANRMRMPDTKILKITLKHKSLVYYFKIWKVKGTKRKFDPLKKILELLCKGVQREQNSIFYRYVSVVRYWKGLKGILTDATERICEWMKSLGRHGEYGDGMT